MGLETFPRLDSDHRLLPGGPYGWRFRDEAGQVTATSPDGFPDREAAGEAAAAHVLAVRGATYGQRDADAIIAGIEDVDE